METKYNKPASTYVLIKHSAVKKNFNATDIFFSAFQFPSACKISFNGNTVMYMTFVFKYNIEAFVTIRNH